MSSQNPAWFTHALAESHDNGVVEVVGTRVTSRSGGKSGAPPAVLAPGGAAPAGAGGVGT